MKVAVTGANGFIGRHVLAELAKYPVEVLAISRSIDTERELPANATAVQLDMQDVSPATFAQLGAPDALIHLAWGGLPNYKSLTHFERELPLQYHFL
ncbi:MAG: NAD(P)-dependent oxidoreductase, partial [Pseudomonadaceae bacterium]|nr:NAD(P)-dependent oxidoreductase [Pseudomonadaceae bacterium]